MYYPDFDVATGYIISTIQKVKYIALFTGLVGQVLGKTCYVYPRSSAGHIVPLLDLYRVSRITIVITYDI